LIGVERVLGCGFKMRKGWGVGECLLVRGFWRRMSGVVGVMGEWDKG
jgi:hypothetical protein